MDTPGIPSWESVLADVEQDVLRTEALLVLAVADVSDPAEARIAEIARQLRAPDAAPPPLDRMPVVPESLVDRVQALRARIKQVRAELEVAMTATRRQLAGATAATAAPAAEPVARFIDRTA